MNKMTRQEVLDTLVQRDVDSIVEAAAKGDTEFVEAIIRCEGTYPLGQLTNEELEKEWFEVYEEKIKIVAKPTVGEYKVTWTIELDAENQADVARKALEIMRDEASIAVVFEVTTPKGDILRVDLLEDEV